MKHKHCEVIKAWAEGSKIQYSDNGQEWWDAEHPSWVVSYKYRVKPKECPKSTLAYEQLCAIVNKVAVESSNEGSATRIAREAANQAITHFIESGEMTKYFMDPENGYVAKGNF